MDTTQLQHLAIVLSHLTDATVDWAKVAEVRDISRKDNAATAFKAMMKKHGIEYANNKFTLIGDSIVPNTIETKAKCTTPRKRKPKATDEDVGKDKNESASPKKKQKGKKSTEVERDVEKDTAGDEKD